MKRRSSCARYSVCAVRHHHCILKYPSLIPYDSVALRDLSLWEHCLITAYNQVNHFFVILGHIERGRDSNGARERETVPPPDSQTSAGLSPWQNGQFLCLCLFLSPAVTLRRVAIVSASSAGGQGCSLSPSPDLAAQQREGSRERAGGQAPNRAGHT